jgi:hypothetical protein
MRWTIGRRVLSQLSYAVAWLPRWMQGVVMLLGLAWIGILVRLGLSVVGHLMPPTA